jgi:hypothetical protein
MWYQMRVSDILIVSELGRTIKGGNIGQRYGMHSRVQKYSQNFKLGNLNCRGHSYSLGINGRIY